MSPKRTTRGKASGKARRQSSWVSRLTQRWPPLGRGVRGAGRSRGRVGPGRIQRGSFAVYFRPAVAGLFFIALVLGVLVSHPVIESARGDKQSAVQVRVQSVAVLGNHRLSLADVARASGVAPDSLASEVDSAQVAKTLEQHPWIRRAEATLLPDGKLLVRIKERKPIALVREVVRDSRNADNTENQTVWRLVDATGTPFARTRAEDWSRLPRLRSQRTLATGEIDPTLVEALSIVRFMRSHAGRRLGAREIELPARDAGRGWVLHSQTLPHTVILGEKELEPRLERLALLLASDLPSARGAEEIDLRFADRAVLRSRSPSR
ncbi:MAG: FtsQ-type POTRA domain-containing protein [Myxococcales bacterium]|nr:FtsQ-type POTRA domain-containing protein [Myxococcales bacterium]